MDDKELREEMEKQKDIADIEGVVCNDPDCCCNNHEDLGDEPGCPTINYHELNGKLVIVMVGDSERPASPDEVDEAEATFKEALKGIDCRLVVTHHAIKVMVL